MKIRTITYGMQLSADDFLVDGALSVKFDGIRALYDELTLDFNGIGQEVQTVRVSLNSFENWLMPLLELEKHTLESALKMLVVELDRTMVQLCSVGPCSTPDAPTDVAPEYETCVKAAEVCLSIAKSHGDLANFRYCAAFNCKAGTPFFPVSFHEGSEPTVALGFENGDVLSVAFEGETHHAHARDKLTVILRTIYSPVQEVAQKVCDKHGVKYLGIDASLNPALSVEGSVGSGMEHLIFPVGNATFGSFGTLAAVSAVTSAVKALAGGEHPIKLVGYCGLMLPVMEDIRLTELANMRQPPFGLRDLLTFSSVCGVGLDTVPIPGHTTAEELAGVYMEVGAMAYRLNKPLSCRLMPMKGLAAGDMTAVESPFLCNTRVFAVER